MKTVSFLALATALAASLASGVAQARGGSSAGDSYLNDAQRNPRFIEPYSDNDPSRYRASNPGAGWDDRQAAAAAGGYYGPYRGRITVRPYGY